MDLEIDKSTTTRLRRVGEGVAAVRHASIRDSISWSVGPGPEVEGSERSRAVLAGLVRRAWIARASVGRGVRRRGRWRRGVLC